MIQEGSTVRNTRTDSMRFGEEGIVTAVYSYKNTITVKYFRDGYTQNLPRVFVEEVSQSTVSSDYGFMYPCFVIIRNENDDMYYGEEPHCGMVYSQTELNEHITEFMDVHGFSYEEIRVHVVTSWKEFEIEANPVLKEI